MRRLIRLLGILVAVVALTVVGLYVLVPENETPEDGSADPVVDVRRPVVAFLRDLGIVQERVFIFRDPLLPSSTGTTYYEARKSPADAQVPGVVRQEVTIQWEPVYRGLLWPVGDRVTFRDEFVGDGRHEIASMRLWYEMDGRREITGVGTVESGHVEPSGRWASVQGYVPRAATAHGVETVLPDGTVVDGDSWGRSTVKAHE